jgi:hypothetical protein
MLALVVTVPAVRDAAVPETLVIVPDAGVPRAIPEPKLVRLDAVTLEARVVPETPEAGTAVAVIVPEPEVPRDAPVPTVIAAVVFVDPVNALKADDPPPPAPHAAPAETILPSASNLAQSSIANDPVFVATVAEFPEIPVIVVPLILKTLPDPAVS